MDASQIKQKYLSFFTDHHNHKKILSSSLVPENDPTVLFNTAGMQPLVPFLMGEPHPVGARLVNAQKCIRTVDIDEVGDASHLTFFEMLGNWSLGDYFKDESIAMSYQFLTKELKINPNRLAVSVFAGDDDAPFDQESYDKWLSLGIPESRIAKLPKKQNWWGPAGQTGPCGPDTEIFYWTGNENEVPTSFNDDNDLWVEIWNNVFMEYEKTADGNYVPLKQKNVDTGMGFERIAMVLQGKDNVYETDIFQPLMQEIQKQTGIENPNEKELRSLRILADHIRTAVFMLGDERSVTPSNVDQGYILRKIIRRSIRHLLLYDVKDIAGAIRSVAQLVINRHGGEYPEIKEKELFIHTHLKKETDKFVNTIEKGLRLIQKKMQGEAIKQSGARPTSAEEVQVVLDKFMQEETSITLSAKWLFDLFQSQGIPPEIAFEEIETNYLCSVTNKQDALAEFDKLFEEHQELSRAGAEKKFKGGLADNSEQTKKLHTATHLLNEALRKVISPDIKQRGSNITPQRLRFDFNFERKLTDEEIQAVEDEVNKQIQAGLDVTKQKMKLQAALDFGAQAEFGQKYPDEVWVYSVGDFSHELCGGPHVENTKDIGTFKIVKEQSSAAGIRRIKAIVE